MHNANYNLIKQNMILRGPKKLQLSQKLHEKHWLLQYSFQKFQKLKLKILDDEYLQKVPKEHC